MVVSASRIVVVGSSGVVVKKTIVTASNAMSPKRNRAGRTVVHDGAQVGGSVELTVHPLTPERWTVLEDLFGKAGASNGCWCMYWRIGPAYHRRPRERNRDALRARVAQGPPPGLLAFDGQLAVGWRQLTPRRELARLERRREFVPVDEVPVWAVSCFYVRRGYRGRGVMSALTGAALQAAKRAGAAGGAARPGAGSCLRSGARAVGPCPHLHGAVGIGAADLSKRATCHSLHQIACDASARGRLRHPDGAGVAWTQRRQDDDDPHARVEPRLGGVFCGHSGLRFAPVPCRYSGGKHHSCRVTSRENPAFPPRSGRSPGGGRSSRRRRP